METIIDVLNQTNLLSHDMNGANAAGVDGTNSFGYFILYIATFQYRFGLRRGIF